MTHRTDRVWLDENEPRCTAQCGCTRKNSCGRYLAQIGKAPLDDFSRRLNQYSWANAGSIFQLTLDCKHFVKAGVKHPSGQEKRVHPPLGGSI